MYNPENLTPYVAPSHYFGAHFFEYFPILGQSRDSKAYERANFDATLKLLGGESQKSNAVMVVRASHWLCGWVETIHVHKSASKKLKIADKIAADLKDYPIVDEELYSQYETEEKDLYWSQLNLKERISLCVKVGECYLCARHDYAPDRVMEYLEF